MEEGRWEADVKGEDGKHMEEGRLASRWKREGWMAEGRRESGKQIKEGMMNDGKGEVGRQMEEWSMYRVGRSIVDYFLRTRRRCHWGL